MSATWVPVEVCTLPTAEQPLRVAEFDALFATALRGVERLSHTWLRLSFDAGAAATARDLVAREAACCSFFGFRLAAGEGALVLDVRVPPERAEVLARVARRAETARAAGGSAAGGSAAGGSDAGASA